MKIDEDYIESIDAEFKAGTIDRKEAKNMLSEYAKESFNFDLNKQKSFENMVAQLREFIETYEEPEADSGDGFTISDLIDAADQKDGTAIFDEAKPEVLELFDSEKTDETIIEKPEVIESSKAPEMAPEVIKENDEVTIAPEVKDPQPEPEEFYPTITLIGRAPGFYTLPWWIYKWILENEDWKDRPEDCPEYSAINVLKSLIYFINRDGQVRIRETRNSQFYTLS